MTPSQVQTTLDIVGKLFPRSKLTPDEMQWFGEQLDSVDIGVEQARAVIEQHKSEHDYHSPKLAKLLERMRAAVQAKRIENAKASVTGNRIVDRYRRHMGCDPGTSDTNVAIRVCCLMDSGTIHMKQEGKPVYYKTPQAREHLIEVIREFRSREEAEDVAYDVFPDEREYERILERRQSVEKMMRDVRESGGKLRFSDALRAITTKMNAKNRTGP